MKASLKLRVPKRIVNLRWFALVLLWVVVQISSQEVWAQPAATSDPAAKIMESLIPKRSNSQDKLTLLLDERITLPAGAPAPAADSNNNQEAEKAKEANDAGRNEQIAKTVVLPPLKGFRQLANSEEIQKMYKDLINQQVPVLVQTMMMVENGAATGFIGSMNMVSNLMNNTVQSQQLQMQLMELTDDTGQMRKAYAEKIAKTLSKQSVNEQSWPVALYAASDDGSKATIGTMKEIPPTPLAINDSPLIEGKNKTEISFIKDILITKYYGEFISPSTSTTTLAPEDEGYKNVVLEEQQQQFIDAVGDFTITRGAEGRFVKENKIKYIKAKEEKKEFGITLMSRKEITKVWENLNNLMNKKCEYKKENKNLTLEPADKILSTVGMNWADKEWSDASAPDLQITENLLDQIYSLSRENMSKDTVCDDIFPKGSGFKPPFAGDYAKPAEKTPDLCKKDGDKPTPCLRFKVIFGIASLIGTSRAYHTYQILDSISSRYVKIADHETERMRSDLFQRVLGDIPISTYIDMNRDKWNELTLYLARYMQGQQGSGGTFKPGGSNAITGGSSGADKAK